MEPKVDLVERSQQIVADYQDGASVSELEMTYGLSSRWIYVILKEAGVTLEHRRKKRPLSPVHRHIARVLQEDAFDLGLSRAAMANRLEWTYQKMAGAMMGTVELSILDLQTLSSFLKRDYNDLMTPRSSK